MAYGATFQLNSSYRAVSCPDQDSACGVVSRPVPRRWYTPHMPPRA